MKTKLLAILLLTILVVPTVLAFFPSTHYETVKIALETPQNSDAYRLCNEHRQLCYAGNMLSDVSVFWYYTKFIRYKVTHTPALCSQLLKNANTDEEKACAIGGCTHQTADFVSHTSMVPSTIKSVFLQNAIVHPFVEQKLDSFILDKDKDILLEAPTAADFQKCKPLFLNTMAAQDAYLGEELDQRFDQFIAEVAIDGDTGYDVSFKRFTIIPTPVLMTYFGFMLFLLVISSLLFFKRIRFKDRRTIINWGTFIVFVALFLFMAFLAFQFTKGESFDTFVKFIAVPISKFIPLERTPQAYLNDGVIATKGIFSTGISVLDGTDASGETPLGEADDSIIVVQYVIIAIILGIVGYILFLNFKQNVRRKDFNIGGL